MFTAKVEIEKLLFLLLLVGVLGGVVLSVVLPNAVRVSFLDGVVAIVAAYFFYRRSDFKSKAFVFVPFTIIGGISLLWQFGSLNLGQLAFSSLYLVRFLLYSLVVGYAFRIPRSLWFKLLTFSGALYAVIGLMQYVLYPNLRNLEYLGWDPHQYRVFGTFLDPNFSGILLVLTLLTVFYSYERRYINKQMIVLVTPLILIALLLTYSRGAYVALIVGVGCWMYFKRRLLLFLLSLIVFVGALFVLPKPGGEGVDLLRTLSVSSRITNSIEAFTLFRTSPLLGYGFDSLRYVKTPDTTNNNYPSHSGAGFHNSWLVILTTTGIVGLLVYLYGFAQLLRQRNLKRNPFETIERRFGFALLSAWFVHAFFDNSLFYPFVLMFVLLCFKGMLLKEST